jgi:hypothetical protein
MPDSPHEPPHDQQQPDLSPEQAQEVRRLLADARHSEPIPTDVAARLDRVLAELATQELDDPHDDEGASVVALASRRRRRVVSVLVAAAAVVAIGVGLDQLMQAGGGGASSSSSMPAADRSQVTGGSAGSDAPQRHHQPHSYFNSQKSANAAAAPQMAVSDVVRIRADHFSADVGRARRLARQELDSIHGTRDTRGPAECTPGDWGSGTFVPVRYAGHRGVLVFRRANGDTQVADLFSCGSSDVLRSITLPAR